ncbi:MAG: hypothetical protein Q4F65_10485 [Propionibacteriaceae bacterium]|nr:hypothetical protein [Propionibacteriaceae bacterium]
MTEKTTAPADRVGISPSGGGIAVWVGDDVRLTLDWDQARQLHALLADQLKDAR